MAISIVATWPETLATHYGSEPWRGYGAGPPFVFARLAQGTPWDEAAGTLSGGQGSYGNGAAMRVAPVALHAYPSQHRAAEIAHLSAIITHTHREGIDGAIVQAVAISTLLAATSPIEPDELISVLLAKVGTSVFRSRLMSSTFTSETADWRRWPTCSAPAFDAARAGE